MVSARDGTFHSVTHASVFPARSCSPLKTLEVHPITPPQGLLSAEVLPPTPDFFHHRFLATCASLGDAT